MRRRALLGLVAALASCRRDSPDDGTAPRAGSLPPLTLRDDTPDLMLTYLDPRGDFHTTLRIDEIPADCRNPVRVVVTTRDEGNSTALLYVADLSQKRPDGTYTVSSVTRAQWEAMAEQRRAGRPVAVAPAQPPDSPPPLRGKARVVVYGASWCGPCHDAQEYLRARGVAFVYRDIDQDQDARREMNDKLDRAGMRKGTIPVLDVGGRLLVGYSPEQLRVALKTAFGDSSAL